MSMPCMPAFSAVFISSVHRLGGAVFTCWSPSQLLTAVAVANFVDHDQKLLIIIKHKLTLKKEKDFEESGNYHTQHCMQKG